MPEGRTNHPHVVKTQDKRAVRAWQKRTWNILLGQSEYIPQAVGSQRIINNGMGFVKRFKGNVGWLPTEGVKDATGQPARWGWLEGGQMHRGNEARSDEWTKQLKETSHSPNVHHIASLCHKAPMEAGIQQWMRHTASASWSLRLNWREIRGHCTVL